MNTLDPRTWDDIRNHPSLERRHFDPAWYDGDAVKDLALLREAATAVSAVFPTFSVRLEVLDDLTTYFLIGEGDRLIAEVYPSKTEDGKSCYFTDFGPGSDETRVQSPSDLLDVLKHSLRVVDDGRPGKPARGNQDAI